MVEVNKNNHVTIIMLLFLAIIKNNCGKTIQTHLQKPTYHENKLL